MRKMFSFLIAERKQISSSTSTGALNVRATERERERERRGHEANVILFL